MQKTIDKVIESLKKEKKILTLSIFDVHFKKNASSNFYNTTKKEIDQTLTDFGLGMTKFNYLEIASIHDNIIGYLNDCILESNSLYSGIRKISIYEREKTRDFYQIMLRQSTILFTICFQPHILTHPNMRNIINQKIEYLFSDQYTELFQNGNYHYTYSNLGLKKYLEQDTLPMDIFDLYELTGKTFTIDIFDIDRHFEMMFCSDSLEHYYQAIIHLFVMVNNRIHVFDNRSTVLRFSSWNGPNFPNIATLSPRIKLLITKEIDLSNVSYYNHLKKNLPEGFNTIAKVYGLDSLNKKFLFAALMGDVHVINYLIKKKNLKNPKKN